MGHSSQLVFHAASSGIGVSFDVSPDGQRMLVNHTEEEALGPAAVGYELACGAEKIGRVVTGRSFRPPQVCSTGRSLSRFSPLDWVCLTGHLVLIPWTNKDSPPENCCAGHEVFLVAELVCQPCVLL